MNLELKFRTNMHDRLITPGVPYDGTHIRVITVDNIRLAREVAWAMLGEEIEINEKLKRLKSVRPTNKPPAIYVWDGGRHCWERVIAKLGIHPDAIEYIWSEVNGMEERVGFKKIK